MMAPDVIPNTEASIDIMLDDTDGDKQKTEWKEDHPSFESINLNYCTINTVPVQQKRHIYHYPH